MRRRQMTVEEALEHASSARQVPAWVTERAAEQMPRYLWIVTDGRDRWLRCEGCDTGWQEHRGRKWPSELRQGVRTACPRCGELVVPKRMGRGFRNIRDRLKLVWYEKSAEDPNTVVAYGAWCERDFAYADEERPWALPVDVEVRSFAVFIPGEDGYRYRHCRLPHAASDVSQLRAGTAGVLGPSRPDGLPPYRVDRWGFRRVNRLGHLTFGDQCGPSRLFCEPVRAVLLDDTLDEALRGTPFGRAWSWEYLMNDRDFDGVEALTLIARYPCVEYMTKLGLTDFLPARLRNELPPGEVNWRGGSMAQVFRLDRGRLGELKHAGIALTPALLVLLHWLEARGIRLTVPAAANVAVLLERYTTCERMGYALDEQLERFQPGRARKALKYMARTAEKIGDTRLNCGDFFDYWSQMARLGENLNDDANAFPADLRAAEARATERLRRQKDEMNAAVRTKQDEAIARRLPKLAARYGFSFGGLTLRPARDSAEVIREGKILHHCVGSYVGNYAAGHTTICVLRRDADPDMPWRTVEIKDGRLIQDRGYHNDVKGFGLPLTDSYRAALACFWAAWRERSKSA